MGHAFKESGLDFMGYDWFRTSFEAMWSVKRSWGKILLLLVNLDAFKRKLLFISNYKEWWIGLIKHSWTFGPWYHEIMVCKWSILIFWFELILQNFNVLAQLLVKWYSQCNMWSRQSLEIVQNKTSWKYAKGGCRGTT